MVMSFETFDNGTGVALYAGGGFTHAGGTPLNYIGRWDGTTWSALAGGMNSTVPALEVFGGELVAAGFFTTAGGASIAGAASWNGTSWSPLGAGLDNGSEALAVFDEGSGPALFAGGYFLNSGSLPVSHIARWDGTSWSAVGGGVDNAVFSMVTYDDGTGEALYATGRFLNAGGVPASYLARWDGTTWSAVGGGLSNRGSRLAVFDDGSGQALYVGGSLNAAGGGAISNIARWDGTSWDDVGGGVDGMVRGLAVYDDGTGAALFACGSFFNAGGQPAVRIAKWDGTTWSALGAGVGLSIARVLHAHDDGRGPALYQGGRFTTAGGQPATHIAKWEPNPGVATYCTAGTTTSGCHASISAVGTPSVSLGSGFDVTVASVEGGKAGLIFFTMTGPLANPWGGGTSLMCVGKPRRRTGAQLGSGTPGQCDGSLQLDFNTWMTTHGGYMPAQGQQVWMQGWFRDPTAPGSMNLSDALTFTVCP
jgi:hypothetical protein